MKGNNKVVNERDYRQRIRIFGVRGRGTRGESVRSPSPNPKDKFTVRFSDPNNPDSERQIHEIESDEIFVRTDTSVTETVNLIQNVSAALEDVDRFVGRTQNLLDQTMYENMNEEIEQPVVIDMEALEKDNQNVPTEDSL